MRKIPLTRIWYLPFINAPPSDYSSIYTTLLKLVETATALGQEHILVTADVAIYSNQFIKERLSKDKKKSFWDPIPKTAVVKTFSSMQKCLSSDTDRKDTEVLFRRLLAVSKNRDVDMRKVLSYELAAVPPSMFHDDGSMRKTNKSDLAKKLAANADKILALPHQDRLTSSQSSAYLIDGMAMCQALNENHFKTFDELGNVVLK